MTCSLNNLKLENDWLVSWNKITSHYYVGSL